MLSSKTRGSGASAVFPFGVPFLAQEFHTRVVSVEQGRAIVIWCVRSALPTRMASNADTEERVSEAEARGVVGRLAADGDGYEFEPDGFNLLLASLRLNINIEAQRMQAERLNIAVGSVLQEDDLLALARACGLLGGDEDVENEGPESVAAGGATIEAHSAGEEEESVAREGAGCVGAGRMAIDAPNIGEQVTEEEQKEIGMVPESLHADKQEDAVGEGGRSDREGADCVAAGSTAPKAHSARQKGANK